MTIHQTLQKGIEALKSLNLPHYELEAEILLLDSLKKTAPKEINNQNLSRGWLLANPDFQLELKTVDYLDELIRRRQKFEPIAYLTNSKEFYSLNFYVDQRVLIPRPESEILVDQAIDLLSQMSIVNGQMSVLELGTGSGCLIITLIKELEKKLLELAQFNFVATDISNDALAVARKNAKLHNVSDKITFLQSNLFDTFTRPQSSILNPKYSLILANLPYVPAYWLTESPSEFGLIHEPKIAVTGGQDGTLIYERFFRQASKFLSPDGIVLIECEDDQIKKILEILKKQNYKFNHQIFRDYNNLQRMIQIKILQS